MNDPFQPVIIEQTITFNEDGVENWEHRFITDNDFLEPWAIHDGLKYGWLSFQHSVTDSYITISSIVNLDIEMKATSVNVTNHSYFLKISVSRKSGISVTESSYQFDTLNNNKDTYHWHEYQASGNCTVAPNKF